MEESADQAVHLGANVTIFIIALTISITLLLGVRDLATNSSKLQEKIDIGTVLEVPKNNNIHKISGYEVLAYYYNYIVPFYTETVEETNETEKIYLNEDIDIRIDRSNSLEEFYIMKGKNDNKNYRDIKNYINLSSTYEIRIGYNEEPIPGEKVNTIIYIKEVGE